MAGAIASGGRLKDRYRLERLLGRGGMAAVWLGHDEVLDRPVAVKVLSDTIASDPDFVARFRREARMAAGLSHPNLVGVYDFSDEGERPYLVMQFVPGEDLASRLERGGRVDRDQLARELLDALSHIHEVGILHRDVKPANIVIEPSGTAKLIDFGIALPRDATSLTSTGLVLGTERYTAPEVMEGQPATERSDLYSCGLVLRSCRGPASRALRALVEAMTSWERDERPLSARHALAQLEQRNVVLGQPTEALRPPADGPTEPLRRRDDGTGEPAHGLPGSEWNRRTIPAAILGLLAALTVVALVALNGGDRPTGGGGEGASAVREGEGGAATAARDGGIPSSPAAAVDGAAASRAEASEGAESEATAGTEADPEAAPPPQPSGSDPAQGAALNEQGFAMIQAGEYAEAVPVLEDAVASFPAGTDDLDYAYALFNLGNALRLSGNPEQAIPVLEQRLRIPNQEGEVRKELEAAYAEAGAPTSFGEDDD